MICLRKVPLFLARRLTFVVQLQWFQEPFKYSQIPKRRRNTTNSAEIPITDLVLGQHPHRRPSAALQGRPVMGEVPCSKMKFHQKNSSIDFSGAEWVERLVSSRLLDQYVECNANSL